MGKRGTLLDVTVDWPSLAHGDGQAPYHKKDIMAALTMAERLSTIAAAAAHDLNNELLIILSAARVALRELPDDHPARQELIDMERAGQRAAWKTVGLLRYCSKRGARLSAAPMERLIETLK